MPNRDIALTFLERFCAGDMDGLVPLLAPDLRLRGPLVQFDTRDAYLASLRADPPEPCECRVLSVTENTDCVSVYYEYGKPDRSITISQLFKIDGGTIQELLLVFDARGFG